MTWPKTLYRVRVDSKLGSWQVDDTGDRRTRSPYPVVESVPVIPASIAEELSAAIEEALAMLGTGGPGNCPDDCLGCAADAHMARDELRDALQSYRAALGEETE